MCQSSLVWGRGANRHTGLPRPRKGQRMDPIFYCRECERYWDRNDCRHSRFGAQHVFYCPVCGERTLGQLEVDELSATFLKIDAEAELCRQSLDRVGRHMEACGGA